MEITPQEFKKFIPSFRTDFDKTYLDYYDPKSLNYQGAPRYGPYLNLGYDNVGVYRQHPKCGCTGANCEQNRPDGTCPNGLGGNCTIPKNAGFN